MKRKVIKQGHNTLTVTLPRQWAERYGVRPGDEVDIVEQESSLLINRNGNGSMPSSTTIDISGLPAPVIWRYVTSAYRAGYDEIAVTGIGAGKKVLYSAFSYNTLEYLKDNTQGKTKLEMSPMEAVSACVNRLIGVEIIDQKSDFCLIKDMSEVTDKEFNNALRRIFLLLQTETENIKNGFNGDVEGMKSILIIDTNLDRFEDFCFRVLNKKGYTTFRKTNVMHSIIFTLESIGDELKKIAVHMLESKEKYSDKIAPLFDVQIEQINRFYRLFYKFSKEAAAEIYKADEDGTKMIEKHCKHLNDEEKELLHHFKKVGIQIMSLTE